MRLFYIDTSSSYLYIGIVENDSLLSESKLELKNEMSKYTDCEIKKIFNQAKIEPADIDKIIIVSGPGSYTGIRIGMTFAKIFAYTMKKKITTITSLEAMAYSTSTANYIVPIIDARRGFVFAGIYKDNENVLDNQYIKLDKLCTHLKNLNQKITIVTDDKNKEALEKTLNENNLNNIEIIPYKCDILKIVLKVKNKEEINPHLIEPTYLKLTEAEENLNNIHYDN